MVQRKMSDVHYCAGVWDFQSHLASRDRGLKAQGGCPASRQGDNVAVILCLDAIGNFSYMFEFFYITCILMNQKSLILLANAYL